MGDAALAGAGAVMAFFLSTGVRDDPSLRTMSFDDQRNAPITELAGVTGLGAALQGYSNVDLVALALTGSHGVRGALLTGGFRSWHELNAMTFDDQRNALINALADHSAHSIGYFQGLDDAELGGCGGVMVMLREGHIRDDVTLSTLSTDDQRNILIVEIDAFTGMGRSLQQYTNAQLVRIALGDTRVANYHERIHPEPPIDPDLLLDPPQISLRYKGLACFAETRSDWGSSADEPYVILTVATPSGVRTVRSRIYPDVDSGDSCDDDVELYRGPALGCGLHVVVMENDFGDPDKYLSLVRQSADAAAHGIATVIDGIPVVGSTFSQLFELAWDKYGGDIVRWVNDLLDTADDTLGQTEMYWTRHQLTNIAATPDTLFRSIWWKVETPLISGAGADYKAYFSVAVV